jgi:hypothetical protein
VRVDLRRLDVLVPEQFLYVADVVAALEQVRGEAVAERVARRGLVDARRFRREHVLSAPFERRCGVLALEGERHLDAAMATGHRL